jgi:O-antigen ligase
MIVGSILLYPSGASELRPASARLGTLVHGVADVSSRHRLAETQEAIRRIEEDPLTGIGLGGTITFVSPLYNEQQQAANVRFSTSYLHNSYTWIALKLGIPALLLLLWIALRSMVRCVRLAASNDRLAHSLTVSGAACLVASVLFSATGPHLTDLNSVPLVAILLALPDVVERITQK